MPNIINYEEENWENETKGSVLDKDKYVWMEYKDQIMLIHILLNMYTGMYTQQKKL